MLFTLVIPRKGSQVLLGMKKRGFGAGKWNGFGGKVEEGETVEQAARRELQEEVGLVADTLVKRAVLLFHFARKAPLEVHLFETRSWIGEPTESEEMRPRLFAVDEIPFAEMWPDDEFWFPIFLEGKRFTGSFHFSDDETIVSHSLEVVGE